MDDDGVQGNESVNDGIFEEIASANHELYASRGQLDKAASDPAATGKTGGGTPAKQKPQADDEVEGDNREGLDTQDFSREKPEPTEDEVEEPKSDATSQSTTETTEDLDAWKKELPTPPAQFTLEPPKPDEFGQIDPLEYTTYVTEKAKYEIRQEQYNQFYVSRSFEEAEKILPELKTNPTVQALVRNNYLSQVYGGQEGDVVSIARDIKSLLGGAKSEGAQSAKTSITIQKNAAIESKGSSQKKSAPTKSDNLSKRLQKGDTTAFEELMGNWLDEGRI